MTFTCELQPKTYLLERIADCFLSFPRLAKKASNNFKVAKDAVTSTGLKFSVTGHGVGGAVAALAALDLGSVASEPKVHYSHNQGMPRAFNYPAVGV
jgi:alpha-beta hydrolase superfamily lysophospholipase